MLMNNSDYWEKRFNILNENLLKNGENSIAEMNKAYNIAADNIQKEIESFYKQFAVNNNLSLSDAKKLLTSDERKLFQIKLKDYIKIGQKSNLSKEWIKKLKNASLTYRIDRLTALKIQMQQYAEFLQTQKSLSIYKALSNIYENGYYKTIFEIQRGLGIGSAFSTLDTNTINKVLAKPWTTDGKNFSEKIWGKDRTNLLHQLNTTLTQGIIRGVGHQQIINEMTKVLNTSKSAVSRLVMTESTFFSSASRLDGYKQLKIKKFKYLATLDSRTSSICIDMDGKIFNLEDYQIGINAPPLHPWCRSTTVPYFDDEFTKESQRSARDENNNTYFVPSNMTYKQWYDIHVQNKSENKDKNKKGEK